MCKTSGDCLFHYSQSFFSTPLYLPSIPRRKEATEPFQGKVLKEPGKGTTRATSDRSESEARDGLGLGSECTEGPRRASLSEKASIEV